MNRSVCVIDVPGLSHDLLQHVPQASALGRWIARQRISALIPPWPAVTCPVQATLTTGATPSQHGIVANGLATFRAPNDQQLIDSSNFATYRREVSFWEQSNQFLNIPRFWQDSSARSRYKTALLFFQNSMPGFSGTPRPSADIVITPKPEHGPDGKITSLLWTEPRDLQHKLFEQCGPFPLMNYWGPLAGIASSQWIAKAAAWVWTNHHPRLQLVYVPHLDYDLQRHGPDSPQAHQAVAEVASALEPLLDVVLPSSELVLLSEYSMRRTQQSVPLNRLFSEAGLLVTRDTPDGSLIDYARSDAFAMVDHQIAHVYLRAHAADAVKNLLRPQPLREMDEPLRIRHPRAGDLQIEADANVWFDYRWWTRPQDAPGFALTVDIHRKPGYDPLELFADPTIRGISQDASRVRGSHGRVLECPGVLVSATAGPETLRAVDFAARVQQLIE